MVYKYVSFSENLHAFSRETCHINQFFHQIVFSANWCHDMSQQYIRPWSLGTDGNFKRDSQISGFKNLCTFNSSARIVFFVLSSGFSVFASVLSFFHFFFIGWRRRDATGQKIIRGVWGDVWFRDGAKNPIPTVYFSLQLLLLALLFLFLLF